MTTTYRLIAPYINEKRLFWFFVTILFGLSFLYVYYLNQAIVHVVEREDTEQNIVILSSRLSELEFSYMTLGQEVTLERAYALGFSEVHEPRFIARQPLDRELTLSNIHNP